MTPPNFWCPWCEEKYYDKTCVHVKELESTEHGFRVVFRDLADMPTKVEPKRYFLAHLEDAPPAAEKPPADYSLYPAEFDEHGRLRRRIGE